MTWVRVVFLYALAHTMVEKERQIRRHLFWCWVGVAITFVGLIINAGTFFLR